MKAGLDARGFFFRGTKEDLSKLAARFELKDYLRFPRFLSGPVLSALQRELAATPFRRQRNYVGIDEIPARGELERHLGFVLWDAELLSFLRKVTGCPPLLGMGTRVYRMRAGSGDRLNWHNDLNEQGRVLGFSLSLTASRYQGGRFQIRKAEPDSRVHEVANLGPGDLLLFRIAQSVDHRVTPVLSGNPKYACAGWFRG